MHRTMAQPWNRRGLVEAERGGTLLSGTLQSSHHRQTWTSCRRSNRITTPNGSEDR